MKAFSFKVWGFASTSIPTEAMKNYIKMFKEMLKEWNGKSIPMVTHTLWFEGLCQISVTCFKWKLILSRMWYWSEWSGFGGSVKKTGSVTGEQPSQFHTNMSAVLGFGSETMFKYVSLVEWAPPSPWSMNLTLLCSHFNHQIAAIVLGSSST